MRSGDIVGGKYRLTRQIGEGAMGTVWAAVHEAISRDVALKLIVRSDEELRRRLLREARACGQLRHRNIIEVHDLGTTDKGDPFLVMPLLNGETLADLLKRKRKLDARTAAGIGRDVARALSAAHAAGVIHRDLKPANIFLHHEEGADEVVVKVLDFGVSKNLVASDGTCTVTGGIVGSLAYMSPEQAQASRNIDCRADIWALGVVLFEMLTGTRPIQGDVNNILYQICKADIPPVSRYLRHFDPAFEAFIARCLSREPSERVASASEAAEALKRFAQASYSAPVSPPSPRQPGADAAASTHGAGLDTGFSLAIEESVAAMSMLPDAEQAPRSEAPSTQRISVPGAPPASMAPASFGAARAHPGSAPHLPTPYQTPMSPRVHMDRPRAPAVQAPMALAHVPLNGKTIPMNQVAVAPLVALMAPSNVGVTTSISSSVTSPIPRGPLTSSPAVDSVRSQRVTGVAISILASGLLIACLGGALYYGLFRSPDAAAVPLPDQERMEPVARAQSIEESTSSPHETKPPVDVPAPPIAKP